MDDIGVLPFDLAKYPFQSIEHYKSLSIAARVELDTEPYMSMIRLIFDKSFTNEEKIEPFLNAFNQPYPGGDGRSYLQILVEDYMQRGLSVAGVLGHPEDRLTDSPRFTACLAYNLAASYGTEFAKDIGLVVGGPLKFETYMGIPIDEALTTGFDAYYTMTKSDNTDIYLKQAGLTQEEFEEISSFMNLGMGRQLKSDVRPKKPNEDGTIAHGRIVNLNPTATRADITRDQDGRIESVTLAPVGLNTARLTSGVEAYWPAVVIGDEIKLGPFMPVKKLPRGTNKELRAYHSLQQVENAMDIVVQLIDQTLRQDGVANYKRQTEPAEPASIV